MERPTLDRWCATVGPPVVIDASPMPAQVRRLAIVSWNVHVGGGQVQELIARVRRQTPASPGGELGIVLLLQEAYRSSEAVPDVPAGLATPARIHPHPRTLDIETIAREAGLSLAYVPSMRNGGGSGAGEREDRGSAILSSEPLTNITAIELPFGRERRVAVMADVTPRGSTQPLRVVAAHLDVLSGARRQAERLVMAIGERPRAFPLVVGVDTNALLGGRSGAVRALERLAPRLRQCGNGRTNAWLARIDFLFSDLPAASMAGCATWSDRLGSDHVPQVLVVEHP